MKFIKKAIMFIMLVCCLSGLLCSAIAETVTFPLDKEISVTYWAPMRPNVARSIASYNEAELYINLQKMTNIKIDFIHPTLNEQDTAFNLLLARSPLPDLIEYNYKGYPGGVRQAIEDGIIMDVSDLIPIYMPNFCKYLDSMPEIRTMFGLPDGSYGYFPFIRDPSVSLVNAGLIIREDLLAETGLEKPTTIDELHEVLLALKEKTNVKYPMLISDTTQSRSIFSSQGRILTGAWDIILDYFRDNGTVKYGPYELAYRDMLETLSAWYQEGLLETEFTAINSSTLLESGIFGGDWAVFTQNIGPMEKMTSEGKKINPAFAVGGVAPLTLEKGGTNRMLSAMASLEELANGIYGLAISSSCDPAKIPALLAFIDYGYSDEGSRLYSIGEEGTCWTRDENGNLQFTDLMINNPAGVAKTDYWYRYCRGNDGGPFVLKSKEFANLYWSLPMQQNATELWTSQMDAYVQNPWQLKGVLAPEVSTSIAEKQVDIDTYVHEMFVKFLTGKESLDQFDKYREQLEKMGIKEILAAYQEAENSAEVSK